MFIWSLLESDLFDTNLPRTRQSFGSVAANSSRSQYWFLAAIGLFSPFVAWADLSASGWIGPIFLPGPLEVFHRRYTWLLDDDFLGDAAISMYWVCAGSVQSAVFALPLGVLVSRQLKANRDNPSSSDVEAASGRADALLDKLNQKAEQP